MRIKAMSRLVDEDGNDIGGSVERDVVAVTAC